MNMTTGNCTGPLDDIMNLTVGNCTGLLNATMNMTLGNSTGPLPNPSYVLPLWRTGGVVLFIIGIIGNILTLVIVGRLRSTTPLYMFILALAVSDICMNFSEIQFIFKGYNGFKMGDKSVFVCKTLQWFTKSCRMTSAWLIAAVSVYRAVEVKRPFLVRLRNPTFVKVIIIVIWLVIYALNLFYFAVRDIVLYAGKWQCFYIKGFRASEPGDIFTTYGFYVKMFYFLGSFLLPFIAMIFGDVILIKEVYKSAKQVAAIDQQQRTYTQLTVLVLAASLSFFVFNGPSLVMSVLSFFYDVLGLKDRPSFMHVHTIAEFMSFINSSTDFFIYVLAGREIRRITKGLMLDLMIRTIEGCISTPSSSFGTAGPSRKSRFRSTFLGDHSRRKTSRNSSTRIALESTQQVGKHEPINVG